MSFAEAEAAARTQWNDALGKIRVEGGTEDDRKIFYTALYHTMIDPRLYADVDGRYVGATIRFMTREELSPSVRCSVGGMCSAASSLC